MSRYAKVCIDGKLCDKSCPVPSVDNFGNPYPGCARFRLKTQAEIDRKDDKTSGTDACAASAPGFGCDGRQGTSAESTTPARVPEEAGPVRDCVVPSTSDVRQREKRER